MIQDLIPITYKVKDFIKSIGFVNNNKQIRKDVKKNEELIRR